MMLWGSIRLELLMGGLAFLIIIISFTQTTKKFDVLDLFRLSLNSCALQVVPARPSALGLIAALDPERFLNDLAADALFLFLILISLYPLHILLPLWFFFRSAFGFLFLALILPLALLSLVNVLLLEVVEDDAFQIEGVEERALGEGEDMVGVDGADLEGVLPLLDYLTVFGDLCDLGVAAVDGLQEVVLIVHGLNGAFDVLKILLVVGVGLDELDHLLPLLHGHSQTEFQQSQMLHIHPPAHDLIINIKTDLTQFYSYTQSQQSRRQNDLLSDFLSILIMTRGQFIMRYC